jgi:hypothetical protein
MNSNRHLLENTAADAASAQYSEIAGSRLRPCWPLIVVWTLSAVQYSYRYILQVNDPRSSRLYGPTPAALSALKYEILVAFAIYGLFRLWRRDSTIGKRYRILLYATGGLMLGLASVVVVRVFLAPGVVDETLLCALEFIPWIGSVFLVPLVVAPQHSAAQTLLIFERLMFWVVFPFWLVTLVLAIGGIRYPNLSSPGVLLRFGGIMDDPNGYACLILLLMVLCAKDRRGAWKSRLLTYFVMLAGTLSFAGYAAALVMCIALVLLRLARSRSALKVGWRRALTVCVVVTAAGMALVALYQASEVFDQLSTLLEAKSTSSETHVSDLSPDKEMLDLSSPIDFLCGIGGFSENLYWRILVNLGWAGLFQAVVLVGIWTYSLFAHLPKWRTSIGVWCIGVLFGSNGIAYLLTFPLNLLYWSILALLVYTGERSERSSLLPGR